MQIKKYKKLAYVAGPYRDSRGEYYVKQNIRAAEDVAVQLWAAGFAVICPHMNSAFLGGVYGLSDDVWLEGDLEILSRCDMIIVLPSWQFSDGTIKEINKAEELGIDILYWAKDKDRRFLLDFYKVY